MADFAHLHVHTDHSPLDGHASVDELARYIASMGQPGFAITDHGTQSNVYNGYKAAKAISKEMDKPFYFMPGIEAYVAPGDASRYEHAPIFFGKERSKGEDKTENSKDVAGGGAYTHLTMLSYNNEGMHNLFKLNSLAWIDGQYRKPRMDIEIISQHSKGIIATTGCPSGELQTRIRLGQFDEAVKYAGKMQDIFGKENYFLELMDHDMKIGLERDVRNDLMSIAKKLNIPLVATNDLHYTRREDAPDHEHMLAIQSGHTMHEPSYNNGGKRFAFEGEEYYAKSTEEMLMLFPEDTFPGAVSNSAEIIKRSEVTFDYNANLRPSVPLPEGHDEHSYLREKVMEGLYRKRPQFTHDKEYLDRIEVELGVLKEKNFSGYMLVVSDFIVWAKENGILVGPGRGCLSGDTLIPTTQGHKAIRDIKVGDFVFDQNGEAVEVPRVWEWECNEELIEISSHCGKNPIKMTRDHKILVAQNRNFNNTCWVRADEVTLNDFVVAPKSQYREFFGNKVLGFSNNYYEDETLAYYKVKEINNVPAEGKVYDFRVDTTMSYMTESFVVHNSGGGSLVAFLTDITEIEPIEHGLIFERFLNPERDSPPDIDTDFADVDRDKVIEYVRRKYGNDQIAMIITFGLIKAKSAVKDMAKILSEPYTVGESLTKVMPAPKAGREISLKEIFDPEAQRYPEAEEFRQVAQGLQNKNLIPGARGIEGKLRQTGVHAAGVIMSGKPIIDSIPLMMRKKDGAVITQLDYPTCEDLGLIKMDFLGLRNLTVIQKTIDAVKRNYGVDINPNEIYDSALSNPDKKAFDLINQGGTLGIFQLDSGGIASLAKYINVDSFRDISAILALYRPGPMGVNAHIMYADRKNGRAPIEPIHPELEEVLEPILGETYGLIAFQEQIQFIAQKVAGYSLGQADVLRRAMGKKKKAILDAEFVPFSAGMKKNGYSDEAIAALWETLIPFAEYGFNKCLDAKTYVILEDGRSVTIEELYKLVDSHHEVKILSMFEDGVIHAHKVSNVVRTGNQKLWTIRTSHGKEIRITPEHRLLTKDGYGTISDGLLAVGKNVAVAKDNVQHKNWTGKKYAKVSGNAKTLDESRIEKYLLDRGVEFTTNSKVVTIDGENIVSSFEVNGIHFVVNSTSIMKNSIVEDSLGNKVSIVYINSLVDNYLDIIDEHLMGDYSNNLEEIIEIIPPANGLEETYDIEMDSSGPANFIANGIVSHNSHSAAYGLVSYMTAYLKANYGAEFMAANLSTLTGDKEKTATYLAECRHMNIKVLPPDVSRSTADYTATPDGEILVGLHAIRGVGIEVSNDIFTEVEANGAYVDLGDFLNRAPSNALTKGVLEGLIHAGALDNFGYSRKSLFYSVPGNVKTFAQARKKKDSGQFDLFDAFFDDDEVEIDKPSIEIEELAEYNKKTKLSYERHALGLYVSDHPLSGIANMLEKFSDTQAVDVFSGKVKPSSGGFGDRKNVRMAGVAGNIMRKQTKSGGFMVIFELEDISGVMECLIFPKAYERLGNKIHPDTVYEIHGSLLSREGEDGVKLVVDNLEEIKLTESGLIPFTMNLFESQTVPEAVKALEQVLLRYPGEMPVHLNVYNAQGGYSVIELDSRYNVGYTKSLDDDLRLLFGSRVVN